MLIRPFIQGSIDLTILVWVAQWVEHRISNSKVLDSTPSNGRNIILHKRGISPKHSQGSMWVSGIVGVGSAGGGGRGKGYLESE